MVSSILVRPRVTRGMSDAQGFTLSPLMYRTHTTKQSFFTQKNNGTFEQTSVFLKITVNLFKKRCYTFFIVKWGRL